MITTVVSSAEFTYPDRFAYPSSAPSADVFTARGTSASFQVLLWGLESPALDVSFRDLPAGVTPEIFALKSVPVEQNINIPEKDFKPHWPERAAPYRVYDCPGILTGPSRSKGKRSRAGSTSACMPAGTRSRESIPSP